MIEKVNTENNINFLMSLQNFRTKASNLIQRFQGTEEIEPIWVYFELCSYINNEFRINNSICPNMIFRDFKEMEEVPKINSQMFTKQLKFSKGIIIAIL